MTKIASVLLLWMVMAIPASAQERLLPQWTRCHEDYACFTLDQTRELLTLEQSALQWRASLELEHTLTLQLQELRVNLEIQNTELQSMLELRVARIHALTEQLFTEIEQKNIWRAKAETPTVWPLALGGVLALLGVGIAVGALVAD